MMGWITGTGRFVIESLTAFGHHAFFFWRLLRALPSSLKRPYFSIQQVHELGNLSLLVILSSGLAVGFVLALQTYYALSTYGAADSVGLVVDLSLVRELGPVVTALLFAGRAGTSLTAEIGLMKAGEQLSAMELMAVDPMSRVMAPRFIGGVIAMPILAVLFSAVGILGAYIVGVQMLGLDEGNFWSIMQSGVDVWRDVGNGVIKSIVFGVICSFVAVYQGAEARPTPEGVARATTRTVVVSSLCVLMTDFLMTAMMFSSR